jgi:hypothetical protein
MGPYDIEQAQAAEHAVLAAFRLDAQMRLGEFDKYGAVIHSVALVGFVPKTVLHVEVRHPNGTAKYDFALWGEPWSLSHNADPAGIASVLYVDIQEDVLLGDLASDDP